MRRVLLASISLASLILLSATPLLACGDKILVLSRAARFGDFSARHRASILAYVPATMPASAAVNDPQFHAALKKAGHKLRLIDAPTLLAEAVRSGKYDLILTDLQDAYAVEQQAEAALVTTVVIPVVYEGADIDPATASHFGCVRKASNNNRTCLSTIDKAVELKLKRDKEMRRVSK
jgi:hypothetical protein